MEFRGVHFRPVMNAAGARGWFGEGYLYHKLWKVAGLSWKNCGLIAKTTTLHARKGNMERKKDQLTPKELMPSCIVVRQRRGVVLNAVGLGGPGAQFLFEKERWQRKRDEPLFLSFMSTAPSPKERLEEMREFVNIFSFHQQRGFPTCGLELNESCPNTGRELSELFQEVGERLDIAGRLGIPLQCKFNAVASVEAVCEMAKHPQCDAITMSNTIPWGKLPDRIDWKGLFESDESPLAKYGGGGLSGWPLTSIVCDWIKAARECGLCKPVWGCGGVDSVYAVDRVKKSGATGVQLGTIAMLFPDRMKPVIQHANALFRP